MGPEEEQKAVEMAEVVYRHRSLGRYEENEFLRRRYDDAWVHFRLAVDLVDQRETMRRVEELI